jgi:hypothetical protein
LVLCVWSSRRVRLSDFTTRRMPNGDAAHTGKNRIREDLRRCHTRRTAHVPAPPSAWAQRPGSRPHGLPGARPKWHGIRLGPTAANHRNGPFRLAARRRTPGSRGSPRPYSVRWWLVAQSDSGPELTVKALDEEIRLSGDLALVASRVTRPRHWLRWIGFRTTPTSTPWPEPDCSLSAATAGAVAGGVSGRVSAKGR